LQSTQRIRVKACFGGEFAGKPLRTDGMTLINCIEEECENEGPQIHVVYISMNGP
jgi:hypothetical protein